MAVTVEQPPRNLRGSPTNNPSDKRFAGLDLVLALGRKENINP